MVITELLERNARLYGGETALVELNPSEERDRAMVDALTWRDFSLIQGTDPDAPYRRELSWKDFDRRANRFANLLLSRGIQRGTKVGILLMNCLEWLPLYFGILKAGCVAVPMNFRYSSEEIRYCLDLADVEVLVFGPEFIGRMEVIAEEIPGVRTMFFVGRNGPSYTEDCCRLMGFCSSSAPPVALEEEDYAAIYFSSGTTGFPKAILHNHRALIASCRTEQKHHGQTRKDVFLCIPPLYHTGAKMHWFGSLLSASKAVLLRGVKPEWILRTITEEKCTIVWLLVPWAQDLLDAIDSGKVHLDDYLLDQWRLMHIGAQPVPPSLIHRWQKVFPHHAYDTNYGLSESLGPGCVHLGVENIRKVGAIGKPGYQWEARIVDERGQDVAQGEIGELARRGSSIWWTGRRTWSSPAARTCIRCRLRTSSADTTRSRMWPSSACRTSGWVRSPPPSLRSRRAWRVPRRRSTPSARSCPGTSGPGGSSSTRSPGTPPARLKSPSCGRSTAMCGWWRRKRHIKYSGAFSPAPLCYVGPFRPHAPGDFLCGQKVTKKPHGGRNPFDGVSPP